MADIGKLAIILSANAGPMEQEIDRSAKKLKEFNDKSSSGAAAAAPGYLALAAAAAAAVVAVGVLIANNASQIEQQARLARNTGATVEEISRLSFVANEAGINSQQLAQGLQKFEQVVGKLKTGQAEDMAAALGQIGINAQEFGRLGLERQLATLARGLENVSDASVRASLSQRILGESQEALLPLLSRGSEFLERRAAIAQRFGAVVSAEDSARVVAAVQAAQEARAGLVAVGQGFLNAITSAISPAVEAVSQFISDALDGGAEYLTTAREFIGSIFSGIGAIIRYVLNAERQLAPVLTGVLSVLTAIWNGAKEIGRALWPIVEAVMAIFDAFGSGESIFDRLGTLIRGLASAITSMVEIVKPAIEGLVEFTIEILSTALRAVERVLIAVRRVPGAQLAAQAAGVNIDQILTQANQAQVAFANILAGNDTSFSSQGGNWGTDVAVAPPVAFATALGRDSSDAVAQVLRHQFGNSGRDPVDLQQQQLAATNNQTDVLNEILDAVEEGTVINGGELVEVAIGSV